MPALSDSARAELAALLAAYPAKNHPGTVVGVVGAGGDVLFLEATGIKDLASGAKLEVDTLVTSIAALQVVDAGRIGLDDPVGKICPELADPFIIVGSSDTAIEMHGARTPITLRMLLTHTSGFTYPWYSAHIRRWVKLHQKEGVFRPLDMPLVHEPGTRFDYGVGMDWVGTIVERVSGLPFGEFCRRFIFEPLGMKDTTFDLALRPDLAPRMATLHGWDAAENTFKARDFPHNELDAVSGGGGLLTTPRDYLRLLAAVLSDGGGVLAPATINDMFTSQTDNLPDLGALGTHARVESSDRSVADSALVLLPGQRKGWGLGHLLNLDDIPGGRRSHTGEWGGVANLWWIADRTSGVGAIVFNEVLPYGLPAFAQMTKDVERVLYKEGSLVET